jgi:hypothetical protein
LLFEEAVYVILFGTYRVSLTSKVHVSWKIVIRKLRDIAEVNKRSKDSFERGIKDGREQIKHIGRQILGDYSGNS